MIARPDYDFGGDLRLSLSLRNEKSRELQIEDPGIHKEALNRGGFYYREIDLLLDGIESNSQNQLVFLLDERPRFCIDILDSFDLDCIIGVRHGESKIELPLKQIIEKRMLWLGNEDFLVQIVLKVDGKTLLQAFDKKTHKLVDPIYSEVLEVPRYTPKHLGFLVNFLINNDMAELNEKYNRLAIQTL